MRLVAGGVRARVRARARSDIPTCHLPGGAGSGLYAGCWKALGKNTSRR